MDKKTILDTAGHSLSIDTMPVLPLRDVVVFPQMVVDGQVVEHYPAYCSLVHSSIYMDLEQVHLPYRDLWAEEGRYFPSDGDMWERITAKCRNENLKSYVIRQVTCVHENENY